ncbi:sorbitol dehydrogenase-like [Plakobranchus ocellatus]|uniref:Sorbitol dehydrogenase n=1 Tax=Plakobranchus ocellatus TaxID=259542 RepID=A0AAV4CYL4_9GAST|nr:sorbitol dehydrogenase-like [Plakobranchus ocellatus]
MSDTNLSLILYGIKDLRLEERSIPEPGPKEVQISIRSVGLCGSDVGYWQKGRMGNLVVTSPMMLGHEPSGVITKLGSEVKSLVVGDRVAIEPNRPCGTCYYCKRGRYNVCADLHYLATPPQDGCITRYFCHPARFVYRLPDNVSFDEGALVQPLALGFYACERGGLRVGHYLLITGAGRIIISILLLGWQNPAQPNCLKPKSSLALTNAAFLISNCCKLLVQ